MDADVHTGSGRRKLYPSGSDPACGSFRILFRARRSGNSEEYRTGIFRSRYMDTDQQLPETGSRRRQRTL